MAGKNKKSTVEVVYELAKPIADSLGLNIWDIRFLKEGAGWYLRIFIDKPEGVTIEDCENMSRAIDEPLDKADPIDQNYCLEVCSPGLERELIKEVSVPCCSPVSTTWQPAKTRCISAGVAAVHTSQSLGATPSSASRTQPPTT